jgi:pantoate--beta-alanine ligase
VSLGTGPALCTDVGRGGGGAPPPRPPDAAEAAVAAGERDPARVAGAARAAMEPYGVEPEYLALVDPQDLRPLEAIDGDVLVAVAARVGTARLIDNTLIGSNGSA